MCRSFCLFATWALGVFCSRISVFVALLGLSGFSVAADNYFSLTVTVNRAPSTFTGGTAGDACRKAMAVWDAGTAFSRSVPKSGSSDYICYSVDASGKETGVTAFFRTCSAATPFFNPNTGACQASAVPTTPTCNLQAGTKFTFTAYRGTGPVNRELPDEGTVPPYPRSSPTCGLTDVPDVKSCYTVVKNGRKEYICTFEGISNGQAVPAGSGPPAAPPPTGEETRTDVPPSDAPDGTKCPKGTVNIGTNSSGVPICAGTGTDPKNPSAEPPKSTIEKTETGADGSKTTVKNETVTNSDGSTTTTKTTTVVRSNGQVDVSQEKTTSNNKNGDPGKDDSNDADKYNLCKQKPELNVCKNSTVEGKCGEIKCTGDAIQCATLRATALMQCKQKDIEEEVTKSDQFIDGAAILKGKDPKEPSFPTAANGASISMGKVEAEGWLGGGAPFQDITFSIQGKSIVIPVAEASSYLIVFRYALMIAASLISFRILQRATLSE